MPEGVDEAGGVSVSHKRFRTIALLFVSVHDGGGGRKKKPPHHLPAEMVSTVYDVASGEEGVHVYVSPLHPSGSTFFLTRAVQIFFLRSCQRGNCHDYSQV